MYFYKLVMEIIWILEEHDKQILLRYLKNSIKKIKLLNDSKL